MTRCNRHGLVWQAPQLFRGLLLCLLLLLPLVAAAVSVKEQALKSLQCGELDWNTCKRSLAALNPEDQYRLVEMLNGRYRYGRGDLDEIKWYLLDSAATRGHARAQYDMADRYYYSRTDLTLAAQWYDRVAENPAADSFLKSIAANRARHIRNDPWIGWIENFVFMGAVLLLLTPIFVPFAKPRADVWHQVASLMPNAFNALAYMSAGEWLKHPVLVDILDAVMDELMILVLAVVFLVMYGVLFTTARHGRAYIAINALAYVLTLGGLSLFLWLLGGMASQGAGK